MSTSTRHATRTRRRAPARPLEQRILDAARRLYFAHGTDGVSARKIATAVGVSPTAIYLHYDGIPDVLHALRLEGHGKLAAYLNAVDAGRPAMERLAEMGRAYYRFGLENRGYYALMFPIRSAETPRRDVVQQELFTLMLLRDAVAAGIAAGELRRDLDPMTVTTALWAQVHGVTSLAVSGLLVQATPDAQREVLEGVFAAAEAWLRPEGAYDGTQS